MNASRGRTEMLGPILVVVLLLVTIGAIQIAVARQL
jgi:hypothetical protein